jgi:glycosyltransferase involved in cell wall biosynthesis
MSGKLLPELSVFFPAYNEEANITTTVMNAVNECEKIAENYEIIVINDGSKDKTKAIVEKLSQQNKHIRLINHRPNRGYGGALKSGIYGARFEIITFTDSDGQFDFSEIESFIPYLNEYDMVIGYRRKRVEGIKRIIIAGILKVAALILFRLTFKDIDCAFKVFKKTVVGTIPRLESDGALISTELLYKKKSRVKNKRSSGASPSAYGGKANRI